MFYTVKVPWLIKKLYPSLTWEKPTKEKVLYLTFDDGPHPTATPFVLDQLAKYNAKATFFCIGKNVVDQTDIYKRILDEGHKTGNHTYNHLNGWKTSNEKYFENIFEAANYIDSDLFRPPYGRISKFQIKLLQESKENKYYSRPFKIIMWSVLSGDFDLELSPEKCLQYVLLNAKPGSIIVFHDSTKAWDRMRFALPKVLEHFSKQGYQFHSLQ
ncbi:polysaccharide deacetylase family protein [Panacibacter ginsenosidivorans]|uniref:Polysaccharide deacetylase family protein n=1 Tax=Panacibacter ginsenosidivorans TaxID=1813871 RepID=A0A5B8VAY5_9BACT|nr:polysaccharide deacetylase family protein [Panacibacter ginsenosidivorans]QEC68409.1 polysaccharide deacetylase family protein [Panacibacter ginsenosidivorans]